MIIISVLRILFFESYLLNSQLIILSLPIPIIHKSFKNIQSIKPISFLLSLIYLMPSVPTLPRKFLLPILINYGDYKQFFAYIIRSLGSLSMCDAYLVTLHQFAYPESVFWDLTVVNEKCATVLVGLILISCLLLLTGLLLPLDNHNTPI